MMMKMVVVVLVVVVVMMTMTTKMATVTTTMMLMMMLMMMMIATSTELSLVTAPKLKYNMPWKQVVQTPSKIFPYDPRPRTPPPPPPHTHTHSHSPHRLPGRTKTKATAVLCFVGRGERVCMRREEREWVGNVPQPDQYISVVNHKQHEKIRHLKAAAGNQMNKLVRCQGGHCYA